MDTDVWDRVMEPFNQEEEERKMERDTDNHEEMDEEDDEEEEEGIDKVKVSRSAIAFKGGCKETYGQSHSIQVMVRALHQGKIERETAHKKENHGG